MQAGLWIGAGGAVGIAVLAGWLDHARSRRRNLDRIGPVDWPAVQIVALIVAVILASLAFNR